MTRLLLALAVLVALGIFAVDWRPAPPPTTTTSTTSTSTSTTVVTTTSLAPAPVVDPASAERALRERGIDPQALSKEIGEQMRRRFAPPE